MPQMTIQDALRLAIQHHQTKRFADAEAIYRQVLSAFPRQPDALHLYGQLQLERGNAEGGLQLIDQALLAMPKTPDYLASRGRILQSLGRLDESIESLQRSLELNPNQSAIWHTAGVLLRARGRLREAIDAYRRSIQLNANDLEVLQDLAVALHAAGEPQEAAEIFHRVLVADPNNVKALNNFANLLSVTNHTVEARRLYERALEIEPQRVEIYNNVGNLHRAAGRAEEAIACYQRMLQINPQSPSIHSNILLVMNYLPRADQGLRAEHEAWATQHAAKFYPTQSLSIRKRLSEDKIRIGYVSGDFRTHCVMDFFRSVLLGHDRNRFELFLYSNTSRPDGVTKQIRESKVTYREIFGISDDQAAEMIRADGVDVLIDLAGHTADHRLMIFARKPAPVQMTYLGYPNTTGLSTIDYRITDEISDPTGLTDSHYSEKLLRLPGCFLCYDPPSGAPDVSSREGFANGATITFGSFNNFAKVSSVTFDLWADVLKAVPDSTLLIKGECFADPEERANVGAQFTSRGVDPSRVELIERVDSFADHLRLYHRIDIALDTFPYNGTTTTCEAIWMGVPVITLAGHAHVSRVSASLLHAIGLDDLVANSSAEYALLACELSHNPDRLRSISGANLRQRMRDSNLTQRDIFMRGYEQAIMRAIDS